MLVSARLQAVTAGRLSFSADDIARRERDAERELRSLRRVLDLHKVFMELGAGDCALARRVAGYAERVYALDVSEDIMGRLGGPPNLVRVVHDGARIPVPEGAVDVAFSRALVISQLSGICRALKDGGVYYTSSHGPAFELRELFFDAGFSSIRFYVSGLRVPYVLARLLDDSFRIAAIK
jgi:SAM-dependent methyltransferase